jgi:hypothetical protein
MWDEADKAYFAEWLTRVISQSVLTPGGCWVWQGPVNTKGYGTNSWRSKSQTIHRRVFELTRGVRLTTEQFACHTCDERRCWNPAHLFQGDAKANNNDCAGKGRHHNAVKTHCKYGHEFTPENTTYSDTGTGSIARGCKTCDRIRSKSESYVKWRRAYQKRKRHEKKAAAQKEVSISG